MTTPTPSAHSGEQRKPSDRAIAEAVRIVDASAVITCDPQHVLGWDACVAHIVNLARELERKHEQSEPVATGDLIQDLCDAYRGDRPEQALSTRRMLLAFRKVFPNGIRTLDAPSPSDQAVISDEVLEIAEGKFDSVYEAQYFLDGTTDNKRAALAEVLKWYESAFPRGVGSGGETGRIVDTLNEVCPRWYHENEGSGTDKACAAIRRLAHPAPEAQAGELKQWRWVQIGSVVQWRDGEPYEHEREWSLERGIPIETRTVYLRPQPSASETPSAKDADARDAARYRWLRAGNYPLTATNDEAIDAAIAAQRKEGES